LRLAGVGQARIGGSSGKLALHTADNDQNDEIYTLVNGNAMEDVKYLVGFTFELGSIPRQIFFLLAVLLLSPSQQVLRTLLLDYHETT